MNPLTQRANNIYNALHDTERKTNYIIAIAAGIIFGIMLAQGENIMMQFKPTQAECRAIKYAAALEAGIKETMVLLEPAYKCNTQDSTKPGHMNIALVSDDPEWRDTEIGRAHV